MSYYSGQFQSYLRENNIRILDRILPPEKKPSAQYRFFQEMLSNVSKDVLQELTIDLLKLNVLRFKEQHGFNKGKVDLLREIEQYLSRDIWLVAIETHEDTGMLTAMFQLPCWFWVNGDKDNTLSLATIKFEIDMMGRVSIPDQLDSAVGDK